MNHRTFLAEPAIALTVLCATLSFGTRPNPARNEPDWLPAPRQHLQQASSGTPDSASALLRRPGVVWPAFKRVSLTGMTHFNQRMFTPWLHYLANERFSLAATSTLAQAIVAHYVADGLALPRIVAGTDSGHGDHLVIAVEEG
ncbi:POTRA domain-containing protein [Silvimonas iriomotensis]|uniref:Uncharacterized protein n=1 Tax=Silvimonas iriomotensis TaxID=449662 RepID=A0ABQ2P4T4_9NEIS|nr:POTRA domain-containing protein [Silvimonas iriomotensis]GGP18100.1 hypothetical protein GCM10010970_03160 [Silvimonas iriomotensis]